MCLRIAWVAGDLIVAVVSDKYLCSPFCTYELFGIYRRMIVHDQVRDQNRDAR